MLSFLDKFFPDPEPVSVYELSDVELIELVSFWMDTPTRYVYQIACKEIGMTDEKEIDEAFEKFYFPKSGRQGLVPEVRNELRNAYNALLKK